MSVESGPCDKQCLVEAAEF